MTLWLRRTRALTVVEAKLYLRQPVAVFFSIIFPMLLLTIFGFSFGDLPLSSGAEVKVIDFYLPAIIAAFIGHAGIVSLPIFLASYRELGILKRYQATPVSLETYLTVHTTVQFAALLTMALLMTGLAEVLFDIQFLGNVGLVLVAAVLSVAGFFALGYAISGLLPSPQTGQAVGNFLFLSMFFLSGAAMPRELFPDWLVTLSNISPMTHAVQSISGLWLGEPLSEHWVSLAVLALLTVAATLVAKRVFKWHH